MNLSENQNYSWGAVHEYTVIAAYPVAEKLIKNKQSNWLMVGTQNLPDQEEIGRAHV